MEIAILLGSVRAERQSHRLAYYLKNQMISKRATVNLIDLKNYSLPIFGFAVSEEEKKSIEAISSTLKSSQAVIIVTPEYHSNIPASLKNVLEYCGINLAGKVIGIASASKTQFGGVNASNTLQITLLNLGGYLVPKRLLVPEIHLAFNQQNEPVQDDIREQADKFLEELLFYINSLKKEVFIQLPDLSGTFTD